MRSARVKHFALIPFSLIAAPLAAQDPVDVGADADELRAGANEIVVVGGGIRGEVDAPEQPIVVYDEADIAAYGASSLADLITATAPQTGSGRGRGGGGHPAILINGQRISNFREMRNFPPEAIRRMQVLPEEVAQRYGFAPNQRVINFILKDNFSSRTIDAEYHFPTRGGFAENQLEGTLLKIDKASRLNLYARSNDASMLTEQERGVIQQGSGPDQSAYRSLVPDTRDIILTASWSRGLGEEGMDGSLALNAGYTRNDSRSLSGLNTAELASSGQATALTRKSAIDNFQGGATLNKPLGGWQLTATVDGSHVRTATLSDRDLALSDPQQRDRALSRNSAATSLVTLNGRPLSLPAGDVSATIKAGFAWTGINSEDTRIASVPVSLRRGDLSAGLNITVPIASRRNGVMEGLGDLSLNLGGGLNRLSDFGTLSDWSAGLTWSPFEKLSISASYLVNQAAPSLTDLGNPRIDSFNIPVFDFTRNETALVTLISGGNPALLRETQRDIKLSANWELPFLKNSNLVAEWFRNRSSNVTSAFPLLTPAIEAAFPGRVTRDPLTGQLTAIDRRPVTFDQTHSSRLRWGFNLSGSIGKAPAEGHGGGPMAGMRPPGGGMGRFGGGRGPMMGMMGGGGQGRWNLSVYHTYRFADRVQIGPAGPQLDLLGGDALTGGGVARHAIELEGGTFYRGFGLRFNGNWAAPTRVSGTTDLRFGSTFRLDMRAFVNFDQQKSVLKAAPFLKGFRMAIEIENLFDSRQRVTDAAGQVPLSYQADLIDPRGRMIGIELRKMF